MAADEQPMSAAEFEQARARGDFLPGGAGWDAWQKVIRDKVNAAFELPEGLTMEWMELVTPLDGSPPYAEPAVKPVTPEEFIQGGISGE